MKQGVWVIETLDGEEGKKDPYRTGNMWLITEEAVGRMVSGEAILQQILTQRVMYVEETVARKMGLNKETGDE